MGAIKEIFSHFTKKVKIIFIVVVTLLVVVGLFSVYSFIFGNPFISEEDRLTLSAKSSLEKILDINELSTVDYTYNAIATVKGEKDDEGKQEVKYYCSYKGKVTAGIKFDQIKPEIDSEKKVLYLNLPKVTIQDIYVDETSIDYIFIDEDADNEIVLQEAYNACVKDLKRRINKENVIYIAGKENAIKVVEGLAQPLIAEYKDYRVEVRVDEK